MNALSELTNRAEMERATTILRGTYSTTPKTARATIIGDGLAIVGGLPSTTNLAGGQNVGANITVANVGRPSSAIYTGESANQTIITTSNGNGGGGGTNYAPHRLDDLAIHVGPLTEAQAPWFGTHKIDPDAHHNRQHSITSTNDHTITGNAFQVLGATATNTLGLLTPLADVSGATKEAILKSTTAGALTLVNLTATGQVQGATIIGTTSVTTPVLTATVDLSIQPPGNVTLNPTGSVLFPQAQVVATVGHSTSFPIAGWGFAQYQGDSNYNVLSIYAIQVEELRARLFVADEVRVDRGEWMLAKSYGIVETDFVTPALNSTVNVWFEDSAAVAGAIFTNGDTISIRTFSFAGGILNYWFTVSGYLAGTNRQRWTLTFKSGTAGATIKRGIVANCWGASGQGYIHQSVVDVAGAPYFDIKSWSGGNPWPGGGSTVTTHVRLGRLDNFFSSTNEFGLYAGTGVTNSHQYLRISGNTVQLNNVPLNLRNSGTLTVEIQADGDAKFGSNVAAVGTTALAIFTNAQTYNSEALGAGDIVIGDHAAGHAFWDESTGQLQFRNSTTVNAYVGTSGKIYAGQGNVIVGRMGLDINAYDATSAIPIPTENIRAIAWWANADTYNPATDEPYVRIWGGHVSQKPVLQFDVDPGGNTTFGPHGFWVQDKKFQLWNIEEMLGIPGMSASGYSSPSILVWGALTLEGATTTRTILPQTDITYNLGSAAKRWSTIYANNLVVSGGISGQTLGGQEWEYAGSMTIDANSAGATTVSIVNQGAGTASLDVEGNITLGGTVDGVDVASLSSSYTSHIANANSHHNQSHVLATTSGLGADHTVSGLTAGYVLRASGATTAAFAAIADADLPATIVRTSRTLTSGAGLTGGGDLSADRTLAIGAGSGITVNADDVALTWGTPTISTLTVSSTPAAGSSTNPARSDHVHGITSSSNPGAAASLLATDTSGYVQLVRLGLGVAPAARLGFVAATTAAGGVDFGGDTNLYRSAADTLKTDDTFNAVAGLQKNGISVLAYGDAVWNTSAFFSSRTLIMPELWSILFHSDKRFSVTQSGFATFNGATLFRKVPTTANRIDAGTSATLNINLLAKSEYGTNGLTYANGKVFVHAYIGSSPYLEPASVTGRFKDKDGVWRDLTNPTLDPVTFVWSLVVPSNTYLVELELTITARPDSATYIWSIEYQPYKNSGFEMWAVAGKWYDERIYANWTWRDSNNAAQITLATTGELTAVGGTFSGLTASRLVATNGSSKLASVADLTSWVAGTANRVTVTSDGDGTVTLSGPQDIHTTAVPTFGGLITAYVRPAADSTTALQLRKADGTTAVLDVDTTNARIGIGTTSPGTKLEVSGTQVVLTGAAERKGILNLQDDTAWAQNVGAGITLSGKVNTNTWYQFGAIKAGKESATLSWAEGYLSFLTSDATAVLSEKVRITSNGSVGIGTTAPQSKLNVETTTNERHLGYFYRDATDGTGIVQAVNAETRLSNAGAGAHSAYGFTAAAVVSSTANGNVTGSVIGQSTYAGVRGSNPNTFTVSDVRGMDVYVQNYSTGVTVTDAYVVRLRNKVGTGPITNLYGLYVENITGGATANYSIYSAGGTMYHEGKVGIGTYTSTPAAILHVHPSSFGADTGILLGRGAGGFTTLAIDLSADASGYATIQSTKNTGTSPIYGVLALNPNGGNVGIGNSTPSYKLDVTGDIRTTGTLYANVGLKFGADVDMTWLSANTLGLGGDDTYRSSTYTSGLAGWNIAGNGDAEFNNVDVRGSLRVTILQYGVVQATNGSIWITYSAGKLLANATSVDSPTTFNLDIEDPDGLSHAIAGGFWNVGDVLRLKEAAPGVVVQDLWVTASSKTDMTTYWRLAVVKQQPSAGTNYTFYKAAAVMNYGVSGKGYIQLTADATYAPYIQMATHTGTPWSSQTPRTRFGNLNGSYGYSADAWGFGAGQYGVDTSAWLTADDTNGIRIGRNTTVRGQWDISGNVFLGNQADWHSKISSTGLEIKQNTTVYATYGTSITLGLTSAYHSILDGTSIRLKNSTTTYAEFAATTKLGVATTEHIEISSTTISFVDNTTVLGSLTAGLWTIGAVTTEHIEISSTAVSFVDNTTVLGSLTAGLWTIGAATTEHIEISSTSIDFKNNTTVLGSLTGTSITLGQTGGYHSILDGTSIRLKNSSTTYAEFAATTKIGVATTEHIEVSSTAVSFVDNTTVLGSLTGTSITLGQTGGYHSILDGTSIRLKNSSTTYAEFAATTKIGVATTEHIEISSAAISFMDNTAVLGRLAAGLWTIGAASTEHIEISSTAVTIKDATYTYTSLSAGVLQLGITTGSGCIMLDSTDGIRLYGGGLLTGNWTNTGKAIFGQIANSKSRIEVDPTNGISIINRSAGGADTTAISLTNAGNATFTGGITATSGSISGTLSITGSGALDAGNCDIDTTGVSIIAPAAWASNDGYRFTSGASTIGGLWESTAGGGVNTYLLTNAVPGTPNTAVLTNRNVGFNHRATASGSLYSAISLLSAYHQTGAKEAYIQLTAEYSTTQAFIQSAEFIANATSWRLGATTGAYIVPTSQSYGTIEIAGLANGNYYGLNFGNTRLTSLMFKNDGTGGIYEQATTATWLLYHNGTDWYANGSQSTGQKIWTDGNDGAGSGLDADLLDGLSSAYFVNADNISAGTLSDARLPSSMATKTLTGTTSLTGNLSQSSGYRLATDEVRAVDSSGLLLRDDGATLGIFIADGGAVGVGTSSITSNVKLDVNGQIYGRSGITVDTSVDIKNVSSVSNPPSGYCRLWLDNNGNLKVTFSNGTVRDLASWN